MIKPKILHVITGLEVGGAEMMLAKTLPNISDYDHVVCTLLTKGPLAEPLEKAGITVVALDLRHHPFKGLIKFWKLSRQKPTLCISYLIHADLFVRIFGTLFGIVRPIVFIRNNLIGSRYDRLVKMERLTSFLVSRYFSVSASVAAIYQKKLGYPAKKFVIIPNGIEIKKFSEAQPLSRKDLLYKDEQLLVLMVGKFYQQKGHFYLIEAWKNVVSEFPTARLLLAGDGPLKKEIENQVKQANLEESVQFLGVRSDVPRLLKTTDVFVFPTLFEGMSNALLEAMAAGCAIVTTNIPENKEVATQEEVCFISPASVDQLATSLKSVLADSSLRENLGANAYQKVLAQFSIEETIAKLKNAYQYELHR